MERKKSDPYTEQVRADLLGHGDYRRVAEGTGLTFHWVQKFACGKIRDGSTGKVMTLRAYLEMSRKAA